MVINEVIALVDSLIPGNPYKNQKLQWINEVDGYIWKELYRYKDTLIINKESGVDTFKLSEGVIFNDITNVYVDDEEIPRIDHSFQKTTGYYKGRDNTVKIYPAPKEPAGNVAIVYLMPFVTHKNINEKTLVDAPYDKMYYEYIMAKIHFFNKDYAAYNNTVDVFNASFEDYMIWWTSRNPCERNDMDCGSLGQSTTHRLLKKIGM